LTAEQIAAALGSKSKSKAAKSTTVKAPKTKRATAGRKVAPKYRDPANPAQTWTGRGRTPVWVQALQAAGQLATAEIKAE
jgi:DNA-binding protein H-NS